MGETKYIGCPLQTGFFVRRHDRHEAIPLFGVSIIEAEYIFYRGCPFITHSGGRSSARLSYRVSLRPRTHINHMDEKLKPPSDEHEYDMFAKYEGKTIFMIRQSLTVQAALSL